MLTLPKDFDLKGTYFHTLFLGEGGEAGGQSGLALTDSTQSWTTLYLEILRREVRGWNRGSCAWGELLEDQMYPGTEGGHTRGGADIVPCNKGGHRANAQGTRCPTSLPPPFLVQPCPCRASPGTWRPHSPSSDHPIHICILLICWLPGNTWGMQGGHPSACENQAGAS